MPEARHDCTSLEAALSAAAANTDAVAARTGDGTNDLMLYIGAARARLNCP
jgi:hypothetical protein